MSSERKLTKSVKNATKRIKRRLKLEGVDHLNFQVGGDFSGSSSGDFDNSVLMVFKFVENIVTGGFGLVEAVYNGAEIAPDLYYGLGRSDEPTAGNPDPAPNDS